LAAYGLVRQWHGIVMPVRDPDKGLTWMVGFRLTIVGLAIAGVAAAWLWQSVFLLVLALLIGGGETFESSIDIFALRRERRIRATLGPAPQAREHGSMRASRANQKELADVDL
jgi:hypothetical protein